MGTTEIGSGSVTIGYKKATAFLDNWYEICLPMLLLGIAWSMDVPMQLANPLTQSGNITDYQIQLMYSFYCQPTQFTGICIGAYLAKKGPKLIYGIILCSQFGQLVFNYGITNENFTIMAIGRAILGFGNFSMFGAISYLVKIYIKEESISKVNIQNMGLNRIFYTASYFINPYLYIQTGNYNLVNIFATATTIIMLISFATLDYMTKDYGIKDRLPKDEKKFELSDLKGYSLKFHLLGAVNFFCMGIYVAFIAIAERYQDMICNISYNDSKNIQAGVSLVSIATVLLSGYIVKYYCTETELLFYSTIVLFLTMLSIPIIQGTGFLYGSITLGLLLGFDGVFIATQYSLLIKSLTFAQISMGVFLNTFILDLSFIFFPIITGCIIGNSATKEKILNAVQFMIIISFFGTVCGYCLVLLERKVVKSEKDKKMEGIEMNLLGFK